MTVILTNRQVKQPTTVVKFERWLSKKKADYNYEFVSG